MAITDSGAATAVGRNAVRLAVVRLVPLLALIYGLNIIDRVNVGYASLTMNADIGLSTTAYGLGAGVFFAGYFFFEVPSNLILHRVGAKIWIARIMITWGLVSSSTSLIQNEYHFYVVRFLLGVAEAGLFPGLILYLTYWFPAAQRGRITAMFLLALPISSVVTGPVSTWIMQHGSGWFGIADSWRVMFLLEGVPSVLVGLSVFFLLTNRPADAKWLPAAERAWLTDTMAAEQALSPANGHGASIFRTLANPKVVQLGLVYFGMVYGLYGLSFFLPQMIAGLAVEFGTTFSLIEIGLISSIPWSFAAVAMVLVGRHSDQENERFWHVAAPCLVGAVGLVIALGFKDNPYVMVAGLTLLAVGGCSSLPAFWSIAPTFLSGRALAGAIASIGATGNLSGFAAPYITGWLHGLTGSYTSGLAVAAACLTMSAMITLSVRSHLQDGVAAR